MITEVSKELEETLRELVAHTNARREAEKEMLPQEFDEYMKTIMHPIEDELEKKTPGFYILWAEEYKMYGVFPVDC